MTEPNESNDLEPARERFEAETWDQLDSFLGSLPEPVSIHVWGDRGGSWAEQEAATLIELLADRFDTLDAQLLPRRENYPYYPVIGIHGRQEGEVVDYGVRIIGLPGGYQLTSLIGGIQAVAFHGQQLEPKIRIQLHRLTQPVNIQVLSAANDEQGASMATMAFSLAVASPHIRAYLIMTDTFPEAAVRYSARYLPHIVINDRVHIDGIVDEETMLRQIATAVRSAHS